MRFTYALWLRRKSCVSVTHTSLYRLYSYVYSLQPGYSCIQYCTSAYLCYFAYRSTCNAGQILRITLCCAVWSHMEPMVSARQGSLACVPLRSEADMRQRRPCGVGARRGKHNPTTHAPRQTPLGQRTNRIAAIAAPNDCATCQRPLSA